MGINRKLEVCLNAKESGKVETEIYIISKTEKLTVPVFAQILDADEFDALNEEAIKKNKRGILKQTLVISSGPDIRRFDEP